ncbi:MAG: DEAD/DEAH box helicase family protein [Pseudomonadota bacterium]
MTLHTESEADTRAERIDPVLRAAGWGVVEGSRIRREVICPGRIQTGGKRGKGLQCDYVLYYKERKLAVLEAKRAGVSYRAGIGQAKDYATRLGARFAYSSNGRAWYAIDMKTGREGDLSTPFPSPDELWEQTFPKNNIWRDRFGDVAFETDGGKWEPRYYQHRAATAALDAIANGQRRILLTLATGTGKTSIAFQIAWKLFKARWSLAGEPSRKPRILFLADRNILANQAFNAFSAFPNDAITRIEPKELRKNHGQVPTNASLFFTIFQTFMTGEGEPVYTQYDPDFFDFIIIDECHRGGANDQGEWRRLMEYFEPAVQLGLTATPKRRQNADTYAYFGEPAYTYALRDGIEDGFLTPFKVRQMASTIDEYVYDGSDRVVQGDIEVGQHFSEPDFNTRFIIEERELSRVKEFMGQMDQRQKTLVFCATQEHAAMVRDMINQVKDSDHPDYCRRVTADDGEIGEQHLAIFQNNEKTVPTVLTTSQKLSTGVDARNIRHIVLMRPIRSMIEFKQIIGRGTRTYDGKDFFTIWDFVKAHENFRDPEWDGEPIDPVISGSDDGADYSTPVDPEPGEECSEGEGEEPPREKIIVKLADGKTRAIQYIASTTYWSQDGKPISAEAFMARLFGDLSKLIADEDQLRTVWSNPENRARFLNKLADHGYDADLLDDIRHLVDAPQSDLYDVLAYVQFSAEKMTRSQRAEHVMTHGLDDHSQEMKELLISILRSYVNKGAGELDTDRLGHSLTARYGSVGESTARLGEISDIRNAFLAMQTQLYAR